MIRLILILILVLIVMRMLSGAGDGPRAGDVPRGGPPKLFCSFVCSFEQHILTLYTVMIYLINNMYIHSIYY